MADEQNDDQQQPDTEQQGEPNGTTAPPAEQPGKPGEGARPERKSGESDADWKARSRTWEDRAKAHKSAADAAVAERDQAKARLDAVLKALDPDAGKDDDPAAAAQKALSERDQHLAELKAERLERAAEKAARALDVDEVALLDSRGFLAALAKLDPSADGFADDLKAAVNAAVGANARLKNDRRPAPPSNGPGMGGEAGKGDAPSPSAVDEAREKRRKRRSG